MEDGIGKAQYLVDENGQKTADEVAFYYKYYIQSEGGVQSYAVPGSIKKLNYMPMGVLEYVCP